MPETHLSVDRPSPGVVVATLDNPDQRNAMTGPMTHAWDELMTELADDRDLRVLVVTGAGSAFCSGGDTSWIAGEPHASVADLRTRMLPFYRSWLSVLDLDVPTIAAVNGPAVGAGLCLALACDLRYAAAGARFAAPFVRLGMHPAMAATWLLPEAVGLPIARELLFTGRRVDADEALRIGLVSRVFASADELVAGSIAVAEQIAANGPVAVRLTAAGLRDGAHPSVEAALQYEALAQPVTFATSDLTEGLAAAKERRPAHFTGG